MDAVGGMILLGRDAVGDDAKVFCFLVTELSGFAMVISCL